MRRRKFLDWLGTAAAIPAFAPLVKLFPETDVDYYRRKQQNVRSHY